MVKDGEDNLQNQVDIKTERDARVIENSLPEKPQLPNGRSVKDSVKDKKVLWPVFGVLGILVIVIIIAVLAEREKSKAPPKAAPKATPSLVTPVAPVVVRQPAAGTAASPISCIGGDLHLNAPPLPPLKLYTRTRDGETFLQLTCVENAPPGATNIVDQRVQSLETRVQELQDQLEQLRNPKKKAK